MPATRPLARFVVRLRPITFLPGVTLAALLLAGGRAEAGPPTETLRAIYAEANAIITAPPADAPPLERLDAIRALFSKAFDFRGAAERALGRQWKARTVVERNDFTTLFAGFVQRGFVFWLASVAAVDDAGGGVTINYLGETVDRDQASVRTSIGRRGGREVRLDHDMVYRNRRWAVRDVTIDGISLVSNYRAQFAHVIRTSSYQDLVDRMQTRVSGKLPTPAAARDGGLEVDALSRGAIEGR
ncbi:MAG TPA: ABC transporter substrate-binding protein [Verrucomicrobiae bacterium]|nr:ABC transporter substrate-binding protein [Verrucomicrobiae bacterium]